MVESAPFCALTVNAEIPPAGSFRLLTYRNRPPACTAWTGVSPAEKGDPGTAVRAPLAELYRNPFTASALRSVAYRYGKPPKNLLNPPAPGGVPPKSNGEPVIEVSPPEVVLIERPSTPLFKKSETYRYAPFALAASPVLWLGPGNTTGVPNAPVVESTLKARIWSGLVA